MRMSSRIKLLLCLSLILSLSYAPSSWPDYNCGTGLWYNGYVSSAGFQFQTLAVESSGSRDTIAVGGYSTSAT